MKDLDKLYREAPQVKSPVLLDEKILQASRSAQPQHNTEPRSRWWIAGHAVSYVCIFGVALGVLLQTGFFPYAAQQDQTFSDADGSTEIAAETANRQQLNHAAPDEQLSAIDALQPSRAARSRSVPAVVDSELADNALLEESSVSSTVSVLESQQGLTSDRADVATAKSQARVLPAEPAIEQRDRLSGISSAIVIDSFKSEKIRNAGQVTTRSIEWLMNQSAELFTIRIAADQSVERLRTLASRVPVSTDLLQMKQESVSWLLLHGVFTTRHQAEQALSDLNLPQDIPGDVQSVPEVVLYGALQRQGR